MNPASFQWKNFEKANSFLTFQPVSKYCIASCESVVQTSEAVDGDTSPLNIPAGPVGTYCYEYSTGAVEVIDPTLKARQEGRADG